MLLGRRCIRDLVEPAARAGDRRLESGTITGKLEIGPDPLDDRARASRFAAAVGFHSFLCNDSQTLARNELVAPVRRPPEVIFLRASADCPPEFAGGANDSLRIELFLGRC